MQFISFVKQSRFLLVLCCLSFGSLYAQKLPDVPTWPGNINTGKGLAENQPEKLTEKIFSKGAISFEEMSARAANHPYLAGEIVVAVEFNLPKKEVASALTKKDWPKLMAKTGVIARTILVKQESANRSVALVLLKTNQESDVFVLMKTANALPDVIWSSPNFYYPGDPREVVPSDPSFGSQYHHNLMDNDLTWNITYGTAAMKIGITDDGVDLYHPDLSPNVWINTGEIAGNGIDDDGNGYIDDRNGWDFSNANNNPSPEGTDAHGTHVAGIAAARTNNGIGVAGVCGQCTIVPLQFYGGAIPWTATLIAETYAYAADNGVKVLSTSYNIDGFVGDPVFLAGLNYMYDAGVLHFNSAGNNSEANPPRQIFTHSLFVASTDATDTKSGFSNYGTGIDISAPGSSILSTLPSNTYGNNSGTSMATPNASGAAALIWSVNPGWSREQVAAALLANADNIDATNPAYVGLIGTGRVNTFKAVTNTIAPPKIKAINGIPAEGETVTAGSLGSITIQFNQLMDPATANNISNYQFLYAGANSVFGDGDDVIIPLTTTEVYRIGTNSQNFQVDNSLFTCGNYRFMLISGGLKNPFNSLLDGNGDGTGGDNFIRNFSIGNLYYTDADGDGYGTGSGVYQCTASAGLSALNGDCNDTNPSVNPGRTEICNSFDDNCDGVIDMLSFPLGTPQTFSNSTLVNIPGTGSGASTGAPASAYPSSVLVSGFTDPVAKITVQIKQFSHTYPSDVDMLLVSPSGQKFVLMSDAGGGTDAVNANILFDDGASGFLPAALISGTFKPTNLGTGDVFPAPAPGEPYQYPATAGTATLLSSFSGDPNGSWQLFIVDDAGTDVGTISGWDLILYPYSNVCVPLPLSLLSFNAIEQSVSSVTLQWKTAAESNTSSFEIEESSDGSFYKTAGVVPAVGSGDNTYTKKQTLFNTLTYFRLKMIDNDGQFKYSNIITVKRKQAALFVSENPVKNTLTIVSSGKQQLQIFNSNGQLMKSFTTNGSVDKIDVGSYAAGIYYLKAADNSIKILISR